MDQNSLLVQNQHKSVKCLNKFGHLIEMLNLHEAKCLLRNGRGQLELGLPPAISLDVEDTVFRPIWLKHKLKYVSSLCISLRQHYDNIKVLDPKGNRIFNCGAYKALWYMTRGLVTVESNDTLKLTFTPNGKGNLNDDYYMQELNNFCVCCGAKDNLTAHHVFPKAFRRYIPKHLSSHNHYDILLACAFCHNSYEKHAKPLYDSYFKKYGILFEESDCYECNHFVRKARNAANALLKQKNLPAARLLELKNTVADYLDILDFSDPTEEQILAVATIKSTDYNHKINPTRSQVLVEKILAEGILQEFVETWRKHFIDTMQPKYLPKFWDIKRPFGRI